MASVRTTLNIDDEVLAVIKKYAGDRQISLGQAASDLVQRGADSLPQFKSKNGWVVFDLPTGTETLTHPMLDEWERSDEEEEYKRAFSPRR